MSSVKDAIKLQGCKAWFMGCMLPASNKVKGTHLARAKKTTSVRDQSVTEELNDVSKTDCRSTSINGKTTKKHCISQEAVNLNNTNWINRYDDWFKNKNKIGKAYII